VPRRVRCRGGSGTSCSIPAAAAAAVTRRYPRGSDHPLRRRKLAQLDELRREATDRIGTLDDRELLVAGLGLYAGDGAKGDMAVKSR
jgi:hypothetical protein